MYSVAVAKSIDSIGKATWDNLNVCCSDPLFSYAWIKSAETFFEDTLHPRHISIYKNGKAVLIVPCYIQYADLYMTAADCLFGRYQPLFKKIGVGFSPSLMVYSPFGFHSGVLTDQVKIDHTQYDIITEKINKICDKENISLSGLQYIPGRYDSIIKAFQQRGYAKTLVSVLAYLDIKWNSFDEYLADLKALSQNMYKNARKEINRFRRSGAKIEVIADFAHLCDEISKLFNSLYYRYRKHDSLITSDYFKLLSKSEKTKLIIARLDGRMIGFSLIVEEGEIWTIKFSAHDTFKQHQTHSYFNLMYYYPIELAIGANIRQIKFGAGSLTAKTNRGCSVEPLYFLVKHQHPFYNNILKQYLKGTNYIYTAKYRDVLSKK